MPQKWKTIRVFISSTFRDMHIERDHLVRFVFPELKEKCRKKRVNLIDVDLRWGVSEQDTQDGKALDICLDEIDSCRQRFPYACEGSKMEAREERVCRDIRG